MNVKRLRAVRDRILKEPRSVDMIRVVNHCGTAGCIMGHALVEKYLIPLKEVDNLTISWSGEAREWLGLRKGQAQRLFYFETHRFPKGRRWPALWEKKYRSAQTPAERAGVVARRIEKFIKTKGAV